MKAPHVEGSPASGGIDAAISVPGLTSQQIASFVITLLAAGFLSASDYGIYTLAIVFVEGVVMLSYTGFFHFIVNSKEDETAVLSTMFWIMLGIGTFGGATLIVASGPLARVFNAPELELVLRLLGLMQPFASAIGWASAVLTRTGQMRRYFSILIVSNLGGMIAGAIILIWWQSLFALVAYRAIRIVLGLVLFGWGVPFWPRATFDPSMARRAASYASGLYGSRFLSFFSNFGTDLVLAFLFSTAESGLYRFANRIAMASVDIIGQPLRTYALKSFGEAARNDAPLAPIFARFLGAMVFLMGGFAIVVVVLGGSAIDALFKPEYLMALGAVYALAFRAAALAGTNLIDPVFAARGTTKVALYHNLFWTLVMVGVILLVSPYGFEALAGAQAAVSLAMSLAAIWVIGRWGHVNVAFALQRACIALILLCFYAGALVFGWSLLPAHMPSGAWQLAAGFLLAAALAVPALFAAMRTKVFSLQVFSG
ncbi:oligosaccharide flippase family protein [Sulfitobacter sp. SK012]|uniref:oligosaccharide flippase family protein n=1 Tax=Sulfitobacter sp. SK012 TaxID=1389005 RepID=UPI0013B44834|nr:oligosaccharide flippase family protein [Sulfitobacter sp. SK012]